MSAQIPQEILDHAATYTGNGHRLESALGAYVLGQLYGWRVLQMMHGVRILNRHEEILGVSFKKTCPERTELSTRLFGIRLADQLDSFWSVAKGQRCGRERFEITASDEAQGSLL